VLTRFHAAPDRHAQHEHQARDHGAAAEQAEDLPAVQVDLDLLDEQLAFARGHASVLARSTARRNFSSRERRSSSVAAALLGRDRSYPRLDGSAGA
jgi:hypothetical protein